MQQIENELEEARTATVRDLVHCLARLSRARYLLSQNQRMYMAEELRTVADEFDFGHGERLRQRIRLGTYELVTARGPRGRPVYRLK